MKETRKCTICLKAFQLNVHNQKTCSSICAKKQVQRYHKKYTQSQEYKEKLRLYRQRPGYKEMMRHYMKRYNQLPGKKEKIKQYQQRPEVKEKIRLYQQKYYHVPENKEKAKQYNQRPEVKEMHRLHRKLPEVKARTKLRNQINYQRRKAKQLESK